MKHPLKFEHEKTTQILNYFAKANKGSINKLSAVKLIWLVDRFHLRNYGRPITNDTYYAMKYGPVGSSVKDLAGCSVFLDENERSYLNQYVSCDSNSNSITSIGDVDTDVFSESEKSALKLVVTNFITKLGCLVAYSHKFPEWKKYEKILDNVRTREEMDYHDFFDNPEEPDTFFSESKEKLKAAKQIFETNYKIASFWPES